MRPQVVIGLLGATLDRSPRQTRWERWRPTVDLCRHEDLLVDRLELLFAPEHTWMAEAVCEDIRSVSPETEVRRHPFVVTDPWDFEEVYGALHDFARAYPFAPDDEDYLVHITTGTHVAQICLYLLTESRHIPGRLLQTAPPPRERSGEPGVYRVIDLDLSRYDRIAARFERERDEGVSFLKSGIATRNEAFNALMERIERVALSSTAPMLLTGPTGAGKTRLARRIYELRRERRHVQGRFVELNCATLRGDQAMSALFGHRRGAFTGAAKDRPGVLKAADGGVLFLDEIGELGLDEQAMLLRALEDKTFLPMGADREEHSDFLLIAGTNRALDEAVARGRFREDLLARIDLWTFRLPALKERLEDIEPNLAYELDRLAEATGARVSFNREGRAAFLAFATSSEAAWRRNFRDLSAAVERMATLAPAGRIGRDEVDGEIERLRAVWRRPPERPPRHDGDARLRRLLGDDAVSSLDRFDRVQLADVVEVCASARTLSDAGRVLFAASRERRSSRNDADRLRKYLARFGLHFDDVRSAD